MSSSQTTTAAKTVNPQEDQELKQSKRLWRVINRHLEERPHCVHPLKEVVAEAFD